MENSREGQKTMNGWISVKDKMPTGYDCFDGGYAEPAEYIVHVKGAELSTTSMFDGKKFVKSLYDNADSPLFADEIDYWMPLPEPPK